MWGRQGLLHPFWTTKVTSEKKFRSCTSHASDSPCNLKPDFKLLGDGGEVFPLYRIFKFSEKLIVYATQRKCWCSQSRKGKAEQHRNQPSPALPVFYPWELNLGIRGYKQLVTPGPKLPHTPGKPWLGFRECKIQSPPKSQLSFFSSCFWVSKRSSATLVAEGREHPLGEEEIREDFRNSLVGRDTNGAKIVNSMCR